MRVTAVRGHDIYSFAALALNLSPGLTIVTGPNGSGKTSIGRLLQLARAAVASAALDNDSELNREYAQAGRFDAPEFGIELDIEFDKVEEHAAIEAWGRAALLSTIIEMQPDVAKAVDAAMPDDLGAAGALASGTLTITYNRALRGPWTITWRTPVGEINLLTSRVGSLEAPQVTVTSWLASRDDPLTASIIAATKPPADLTDDTGQASLSDGAGGDATPEPHTRSTLTLDELLGAGQFDLIVRPTRRNAEPALIAEAYAGIAAVIDHNPRSLTFARVLNHLFQALVVSNRDTDPNAARNGELVSVPLSDLADPRSDASADAAIGVRLLRRKTGDPVLRSRYEAARAMFAGLTGARLDVAIQSLEMAPTNTDEIARWALTAAPVVTVTASDGTDTDIPLRLSGQGLVEAARLALVLTGSGQIVLMDEPATELSAVAQRRLLETIRTRARDEQTIVITHSAHLVPVGANTNTTLVRLTRDRSGATVVHHVRTDLAEVGKNSRLLALSDIRDSLFAAAVWLVEGATEQEALQTWLADDGALGGLPTPETAHVLIVPVDGAENFARYAQLMRELGITYGILADGPALRVSAKGQLRKLPGAPDFTSVPDTFADRKAAWQQAGVWTLASDYHDGQGDIGGEVEAYFATVNAQEWASISGVSKIRRGAAFASRTPTPQQIVGLWDEFLRHTGHLG